MLTSVDPNDLRRRLIRQRSRSIFKDFLENESFDHYEFVYNSLFNTITDFSIDPNTGPFSDAASPDVMHFGTFHHL